MTRSRPDPASHHDTLSGYLAADPDNVALIADAASAALDAGRPDAASALVERHRALAGRTPAMDHVAGLAAMVRQDWHAATGIFQALLDGGVDEAPIRYNLAWSQAMSGDKAGALALLDDAVADALPQAAQLRVGLLHELGDLDAAERIARKAISRFPAHRGLNATVSTLAIDLDDAGLARATAERAGDHPEAMVTLATLALDGDDTDTAAWLFDAVLARAPGSPRALVGRGLVALARDDRAGAACDLDRGAAAFGSHLGSWIAAGWAHVMAGDATSARARFVRALAIDDGFAEAHGSIAVLDIMAGDIDAGRRGAEVALRLDRQSFSAALAAALLAANDGGRTQAARIVERALTTPVDDSGRTIGEALARVGARS